MLLTFQLADEDGETIHLDPCAIESLREHDLGGRPVVTVVMESGDRWRLDDPDRGAVRQIAEARMCLEDLADEVRYGLCDPRGDDGPA